MADRSKDRQKPGAGNKGSKSDAREDRLRAALRANLARRKAQSRARSDNAAQEPDPMSKDDTGGVDS